ALYPRFDLPAVSGASLLLLATAAGIAAFFSPCSFSLLVTLLAGNVKAEPGRPSRSIIQALRPAAALALGATLFLVATGAIIALGGDALFASVTFTSLTGRTIRTVTGLLLIVLGLIQLGTLPVPLSFDHIADTVRPLMRRQAKLRRQHSTLGFGLYGFVYILAGFG
ncbi:MAG: cytochrome c biogenesis protein CcdA, partial [Thermomicrobiales bacterium]